MPHMCLDSIDVSVQVINALQRIVSRQMNPPDPHGGHGGQLPRGHRLQHNRLQSRTGRHHQGPTTGTFGLLGTSALKRSFAGSATPWALNMNWIINKAALPLSTTKPWPKCVKRCAAQVVGEENVLSPESSMGGDDMAFFIEKSKGCYFFLGVGREGCAPLHNAKFDFDEDILLSGVETYCRVIMDLLGCG